MLVLGYERRDWSSQCLLAGGRAPEPETDVVGVADDSFRNGQQIGLKQGQRRDAGRDLALICKTATVRSTTFSIKLERLPVVSAYISWARLAVLTGKRRQYRLFLLENVRLGIAVRSSSAPHSSFLRSWLLGLLSRRGVTPGCRSQVR